MAGTGSGTLRDHDIAFNQKSGAKANLEISKTGETASVMMGPLASQSASISYKVGGPDAVIELGTGPGFVYFQGTITPNPTSKPLIRRPGVPIRPQSEIMFVAVPPASGSVSTEFIGYFCDKGASLTVEIEAAYSHNGQLLSQTTTTHGTYIKVITNAQGKFEFANATPQTIPTSTSDPIRQYYDEINSYATAAGINI